MNANEAVDAVTTDETLAASATAAEAEPADAAEAGTGAETGKATSAEGGTDAGAGTAKSVESSEAEASDAEPSVPAAAPEAAGVAAVPEQRPPTESEGEAERSKAKKPRRAVRAKSTGGTKALVVWREGRLHYADDSVLVIDLDEAASPDIDVHDVVDRLAELRDATESTGRAETIAALGEIIQEKALN